MFHKIAFVYSPNRANSPRQSDIIYVNVHIQT